MPGFICSDPITIFFSMQCQDLLFFIKLLASGILFSTAVNAELVAKLLILPSISVTLVLKSFFLIKLLTSGILFSTAKFVAKPLILGILPSTSVILANY